MRIRKRFPPSNLSSLALSDPQLNRPTVVQEHHLQSNIQVHPHGNSCVKESRTTSSVSDAPNQPHPPPSDQKIMIGTEQDRWACAVSVDHQQQKKTMQKELDGEEFQDERWKQEGKSNDIRKGNLSDAEVGNEDLNPDPGSCSEQVVEKKWFEEDKTIPLKKRRGRFERRACEKIVIRENENKTKAKMKSKTNKKCVQKSVNEQEEGKEGSDQTHKKNKRGSVIMEGSRCSRVNGRGWRCCQQTLVGYSLCEHHLGKGRLRSMTSVRNRAPKKAYQSEHEISSFPFHVQAKNGNDDDDDEEDDEERKPLIGRNKRMKLGKVKARSISSLLGQL